MTAPKPRRPMTDEERAIATALTPGRVTYQVASPDKRFAREMSAIARAETPQITEGQAEYLRRLAHRYRRQLRLGTS